MTDPTAPQPLTSDEQAEWKAHFGKTDGIPDHAKILRLIATVEELQAEVDRLTADLATTTPLVDAAIWTADELAAQGDADMSVLSKAVWTYRAVATVSQWRAAQPQEGT